MLLLFRIIVLKCARPWTIYFEFILTFSAHSFSISSSDFRRFFECVSLLRCNLSLTTAANIVFRVKHRLQGFHLELRGVSSPNIFGSWEIALNWCTRSRRAKYEFVQIRNKTLLAFPWDTQVLGGVFKCFNMFNFHLLWVENFDPTEFGWDFFRSSARSKIKRGTSRQEISQICSDWSVTNWTWQSQNIKKNLSHAAQCM